MILLCGSLCDSFLAAQLERPIVEPPSGLKLPYTEVNFAVVYLRIGGDFCFSKCTSDSLRMMISPSIYVVRAVYDYM